MLQLIESVPNFSEGRRPEVIQALVQAIQVPGVLLLDYSSDADHNRSVLTVVGPPQAVLAGLMQAVRVAARQINLFEHRGEHPRIGATDVVPLVPIQGITLEECVTLADQLGRQIGEELELPVYLYAAAARRPERRRLPDIRQGEFEGLVQTIGQPDVRTRLWPGARRSGGRSRRGRPAVPGRLQCLPADGKCRDRQRDRQAHSRAAAGFRQCRPKDSLSRARRKSA